MDNVNLVLRNPGEYDLHLEKIISINTIYHATLNPKSLNIKRS